MLTQTLPWMHPLEAAAVLTENESYWVLLYSGQQLAHTGRFSYLALYPQECIAGDNFSLLAGKLSQHSPTLHNAWFGYLGYELLHQLENLPRETQSFIPLASLWFARFGLILVFDHETRTVISHREPPIALPHWPGTQSTPQSLPKVSSLHSATSREEYLALVRQTRDAIVRGDFYQANITRKFTGTFEHAPHPLQIFNKLCEASPAAYSACLRMGDITIASSSPEQFLHVNAQGKIESRPIKGTAPAAQDPAQLAESEKDRAENLMIVDLMRNDLARTCEPGSVKVEKLFEVSSYATLHHMASTISGQKRSTVSTLEAVQDCFPPGSMTGAPKVSAMEWCLQHEGIKRGAYSGALGWFGGDGSCDLSVVIRTLIVQNEGFEFQVGGGIVADSDADAEWAETMTKARGICTALGIDVGKLETL